MKIKLATEYVKATVFQQYRPQAMIEGVFSAPLKKHRLLEGSFMEYLRLDDGIVKALPSRFEVRQVSVSVAEAGRINAFHLHPKTIQDELWCVTAGTLMVWLVDVRADSPTLGVRSRHVLSAEEPSLLHIPSGVAHGFKAGFTGATLIYAMNSQFNPDDPNEGRLPWDYFGKDLWEEDRG